MCGRFTLKTPPSQWGQLLLPHLDMEAIASDWQPRYNIAPTQPVAAIVARDIHQLTARYLRWGLVPFWADDLSIGNRMINARVETLAEKPAFRTSLAKRRCAVISDGYYEWQKLGKAKQPHWIHRPDQGAFAFASLWDSNRKASDQEVQSTTIITTEAAPHLAALHDRMPVMLSGEALKQWLDPNTSTEAALNLLKNQHDVDMVADPVSSHVNNPRHDDPDCLK